MVGYMLLLRSLALTLAVALHGEVRPLDIYDLTAIDSIEKYTGLTSSRVL